MLAADIDEIFARVKKMLARMMKLKEGAITLESHLRDDLGVDSVDIWEIIAKTEEEFAIEVEEGDARGINTVRDIVGYIERKMRATKD